VQVDPIKPTLKAPGTKRLKVKCCIMLSTFAFKFNLHRYIMELAYHHKARSDLTALVAGAASGGSYPAFLPGSLADFAAVGVLWVAGMAASMAGPA